MSGPLEGWRQIDIDGKRAEVFEPPGDGRYESVVIVLPSHDMESVSSDQILIAELIRHGLPCVAPCGGQSWWLDERRPAFDANLSPMQYLRERVVGWIGDHWHVMPPLIGLMGVGTGGQAALQLAYRDARRFPVVAAISPAVDFHAVHGQGWELDEMFDTPEAARQQTVTLHLHPLNWPAHQLFVCDPADFWHEGCERLASKLSSMGILFERDLQTSAGGQSVDYFHAMAPRCLQFVTDGLQHVKQRQPTG